jgi:hypothetical protein
MAVLVVYAVVIVRSGVVRMRRKLVVVIALSFARVGWLVVMFALW